MDFARKQLEKYGWTNGKGLGKHENGISEALKPKIKRSVAGVGHDPAADFTEHWWNTLYDKAAANVQVEEKHGKTKKIKTKDEFEITNSMWRLNKKAKNSNKEEQYTDYFVKKAVLTGGGNKIERIKIESDTESEDDKEKKDLFKMTDEELFAACEGRTAHKGARHGLKALGKLARIEQQERILLEQNKYEGYTHCKNKEKKEKTRNYLQIVEDLSLNSDADVSETKIKKRKKKRCLSHDNSASEPNVINNNDIVMAESIEPKSDELEKKHKKLPIESVASEIKNKDRVNYEINSDKEKMDVNEEIETKFKRKKKKSNKRKNTDTSDLEIVEEANDSSENVSKKKKGKYIVI